MHHKRPTVSRHDVQRAAVVLANREVRRSPVLKSFHSSFRRQVIKLASQSDCFEALAEAFPGMLFALATGYGTEEARRAAMAHLVAGSRLKEAAQALGLPWW